MDSEENITLKCIPIRGKKWKKRLKNRPSSGGKLSIPPPYRNVYYEPKDGGGQKTPSRRCDGTTIINIIITDYNPKFLAQYHNRHTAEDYWSIYKAEQ